MEPSKPIITQIGNYQPTRSTIVLKDPLIVSDRDIVTIYVKGENLSLDIIKSFEQNYTLNDTTITALISNWGYDDIGDTYQRDIAFVEQSEGLGKYKIELADKTIEFNVSH